jgi:hypothetical protein
MYTAAPRLDDRLLDAIARVDDGEVPIAETYRRIREASADLELPRPSYERVRQHVHVVRRRKERARSRRETLIGVALYTKPLQALYELESD